MIKQTLLFLIAISSNLALAGEWKVIELQELRVDYAKFLPGGRDPLITSNGLPNKSLDTRLNANINFNLFKYVFVNPTVHSMTDRDITGASQFRMVGLEYRMGVNFSKYFDISYYHFSKHVLDTTYKHERFPVQDAVEIRIYLYRDNKLNTILP